MSAYQDYRPGPAEYLDAPTGALVTPYRAFQATAEVTISFRSGDNTIPAITVTPYAIVPVQLDEVISISGGGILAYENVRTRAGS